MWLYAVGHGQLLLRSNKSSELPTRIDVLFKDVAALELPTLFDGLSITETTAEEAQSLNVQLGSWSDHGRKVFLLSGTNFVGYVIAGAVFWHEDEGSHYDESFFQESFTVRV
jgi:hypothetical protein